MCVDPSVHRVWAWLWFWLCSHFWMMLWTASHLSLVVMVVLESVGLRHLLAGLSLGHPSIRLGAYWVPTGCRHSPAARCASGAQETLQAEGDAVLLRLVFGYIMLL
jgi:hypothetical protein